MEEQGNERVDRDYDSVSEEGRHDEEETQCQDEGDYAGSGGAADAAGGELGMEVDDEEKDEDEGRARLLKGRDEERVPTMKRAKRDQVVETLKALINGDTPINVAALFLDSKADSFDLSDHGALFFNYNIRLLKAALEAHSHENLLSYLHKAICVLDKQIEIKRRVRKEENFLRTKFISFVFVRVSRRITYS